MALPEEQRAKLDAIVQRMTADGQSPDAIRMVVSDFKTKYETPDTATPERGWGDTFADALPTIGGTVGGMVGGIPGAAVGGAAGSGLRDLAQHASEIPGAMRDVASNLISNPGATTGGFLRGAFGGARDAAVEGGTQAAVEGGGRLISKGLQAVAGPIYNFGLGASKALRREFPGMTEAGLREGIAVSGRGTDKARRLMHASAQQADDAIATAQRAGAGPVSTNTIVREGEFAGVARAARNRASLGMADDSADVAARARALHINQRGNVPLTRAQELKRTAQQSADSAFRTQERGGVIRTVDAELDKATATGLRRGIEQAVPSVGPINRRTQSLSGLTRGLEDAEQRNHILSRLIVPTAAGVSAGFGSGDVSTGIGGAATTAALTSPGNLSRLAIGAYGAGQHNVPAHLIRAAILAQLEQD